MTLLLCDECSCGCQGCEPSADRCNRRMSWLVPLTLFAGQYPFDLFLAAPAQAQFGVVGQDDDILPARACLDLSDAADIDNSRAVDAAKASRVEPGFHLGHSSAQDMRLTAGMQANIIVRGL